MKDSGLCDHVEPVGNKKSTDYSSTDQLHRTHPPNANRKILHHYPSKDWNRTYLPSTPWNDPDWIKFHLYLCAFLKRVHKSRVGETHTAHIEWILRIESDNYIRYLVTHNAVTSADQFGNQPWDVSFGSYNSQYFDWNALDLTKTKTKIFQLSIIL